jgi:hypothetical protein
VRNKDFAYASLAGHPAEALRRLNTWQQVFTSVAVVQYADIRHRPAARA